MRTMYLSLLLPALLLSTASTQGAEPEKKQHPGVVALSQAAAGHWEYRSFPELAQLFVYERDRPGVSVCTEECISAWPPLAATDEDAGTTVGDWSVILSKSGEKQWAYKEQPVYLRFHDMPIEQGAEVDGFRLLEP